MTGPALDAGETTPLSDGDPGNWKRLKKKAVRGMTWSVAGNAASQAIRLGGNLILTRILYPEAFGLMLVVNVFMQGARMFSDFGIRGSIVQNKRGEDPRFLDTAWTLQVARGGVLWLILCLMTWPVAAFYDKPDLVWLLPVVGLSMIITGFASTAQFSLVRRITPGRRIILDVVTQFLGLCVMVAWGLWTRSVWALVVGALFSALMRTILSHYLIRGYKNRLAFDREAAASLFHFGKWVFISTALTFFLRQGDRVVLGKLLSDEVLGVFAVAGVLSRAVTQAIYALSHNALIPLYARIAEADRGELRQKTRRIRGALFGIALPILWVMAIWGPQIIDLLYDERYHEAGWMLQLLALGQIGTVVIATASPVLLSFGDSRRQMFLQVARSVLFILGLAVGGILGDRWLGGELGAVRGLLIGIAVARVLEYGAMAVAIRRYGVWLPALDLAAFGISAVVLLVGFRMP